MYKAKYRKPKITVTRLPINLLSRRNELNSINDLLIREAYAQSHSLYLPYISNNSDKRLKKNIKSIAHALDKICQLQGVSYSWRNPTTQNKNEIGLIAQEVNKIIPEVVLKNEKTGYLMIEYGKLASLLIEGIKEQQLQISQLQRIVKKLYENQKRPLTSLDLPSSDFREHNTD